MIEVSSSSSSSSSNKNVFNFSDVNAELNHVDKEIQEVSTVSVMPINSNFDNVSITRRTVPVNNEERRNQANGNNFHFLKFEENYLSK